MSLGFFFQKPLEKVDELDSAALGSEGEYARLVSSGTGPSLFQNAPKVAQIRVVFTLQNLYQHGSDNRKRINFEQICAGVEDEKLRSQLRNLNPATCLPAGIKIIGVRAGLMQDVSSAFHVKLYDNKGRSLNIKHLCVGSQDTRDIRKMHIGYPLHMWSPWDNDSGVILETPEKVPETFRQFVMLRKDHVQDGVVLYPSVGGSGDCYAIAKNCPAAALLYHVIVEKNSHITKINSFQSFSKQYEDLNNYTQWLVPKMLFDEVRKLVFEKIQYVQDRSFDCSALEMHTDMLDVFREAHPEINKVPIAVTFEVNLHVPVQPDRLTTVYTPISSSATAIAAANDDSSDDDN